jgi:peptidoglycan/xylan/chitin deacetylase (PgdA/CDA1 family)
VTGQTQTITVPVSLFAGANGNAVTAFLFSGFAANTAWEIGATQFVCGASTNPPSSSAVQQSSTIRASSTSVAPSTTLTTRVSTTSATSAATPSVPAGTCNSLLVDDFASQSRLTFLFYNALLRPSSDDGTMKALNLPRAEVGTSVIIANNRLTLTPTDTSSYWYTSFGCIKATNFYGGIGMTIKAARGTTFGVELQTSSTCNSDSPTSNYISSTDLGWTFDNTERYYTIPWTKFAGLDTDHLTAVLFSGLSAQIQMGPIAFYCGQTGTAFPVPSTAAVSQPTGTTAKTTGPSAIVIDTFGNANTNNLGHFHGGDDDAAFKRTSGRLTVNTNANADISWYTQVSGTCADYTIHDNSYLHIAYTGSNAFSVALQQHNPTCNPNIAPTPYTWDSVEASRYSNSGKTDIYIPISHFAIDRKKGFYTSTTTTVTKIELVRSVPSSFIVPSKLSSAPLVFACTRPNSFAFAIDDGTPNFAQTVAATIRAANIKVTFFTVGAPLLDTSNNLTNVYKQMLTEGHQIAYHSYTHPPLEGLPTLAAIDWEINEDIKAVDATLGIRSTYFRPPFGTEGARIRQRLAATIPGAKFIAWSVDVQDWLWAFTDTPEKQVENFQNDVNKGGNLVVMHYLYESTVSYLPQFIDIAKKTGKQLMRVDQCLEDPNAPPL